jgi:pilus assembly protein Flp/PilA
MTMRRLLARFASDHSGATAIEYAVLAALMGVIMIGAVTALGGNLSTKFNNVGEQVK